jgi:hypothetical protein
MNSTTSPKPTSNKATHVPAESVEARSAIVAKLTLQIHAIPDEVLQQLVSLHVSYQPTNSDSVPTDSKLVELMVNLLRSTAANESETTNCTEERFWVHGTSLAAGLRWLQQFDRFLGESIASRLILKSLMPLYLSAAQGRVENGLNDSSLLIRQACLIAELNRLTIDDDLASWLREECRAALDPYDTIPKAFRIELPTLASAFWKGANDQSVVLPTVPKQPTNSSAANEPTAEKHRAWWSLACQLSSHHAQITVPPELALGVVAWDKLRHHWQQVRALLSVEGQLTRNASPATRDPICSVSDGTASPLAANKCCDALTATESLIEASLAEESSTKCNTVAEASESSPAIDHRIVEIRSARDPQLSSNLEQLLQECRTDAGVLSMIVVKKLGGNSDKTSRPNWQPTFIQLMDERCDANTMRGFISDDGELSLVFQEVDKAELALWIRESFAKLNVTPNSNNLSTPKAQSLVAGVAMVIAPSRSFKIDQLTQAAWRCMEGAGTQGAGTIKTIEVY